MEIQIDVLLKQRQGQKSDIGDTMLGHAGHECTGPVGRHGDFGDVAFGFDKEDFIPECNYGGAAAFLEMASDADVTLFV